MSCYRGGVSVSGVSGFYKPSPVYIRREAGQPEPPLKQMSCREPPARVVAMSGQKRDACKVQKQSQLLRKDRADALCGFVYLAFAAAL
jgi:hypothetical protein